MAGILGPKFAFHGFLALFETAEAVFDLGFLSLNHISERGQAQENQG
jgi:hypothetical protein